MAKDKRSLSPDVLNPKQQEARKRKAAAFLSKLRDKKPNQKPVYGK